MTEIKAQVIIDNSMDPVYIEHCKEEAKYTIYHSLCDSIKKFVKYHEYEFPERPHETTIVGKLEVDATEGSSYKPQWIDRNYGILETTEMDIDQNYKDENQLTRKSYEEGKRTIMVRDPAAFVTEYNTDILLKNPQFGKIQKELTNMKLMIETEKWLGPREVENIKTMIDGIIGLCDKP